MILIVFVVRAVEERMVVDVVEVEFEAWILVYRL